ncbi:hypothetical protein ACIHEI_28910 [Kitasatospora sp. NPDC051984]
MTNWFRRLWEVVRRAATTGYPVVAATYYLMRVTETVLHHLQ